MSAPERNGSHTAVLVGVGTVEQRVDDPGGGDEAAVLMARAAEAAAADAGAPGLLREVDWIAVPQGSWRYRDPARLVAERIGAAAARTARFEIGVPQQTPVSRALAMIRGGELEVALVVGGEARRRAAVAARAGVDAPERSDAGAGPDETVVPEAEIVAAAEIAARVVVPVEQYAIIENACRAADGWGIEAHRDAIGSLWAAFNEVARRNPHAAFPEPRDAAFLRAAGPQNRPLAFPYARWHSSQWTVDQAAALLLCSTAAAARLGVPRERWVFPRVALESSLSVSLSRRAELHRWPAMAVLGEAAAVRLDRAPRDVEHVELYSCFPSAVRVQLRELGLDRDAVPTVTGGMAFAGGPLNNFTYQATAAVVERVRAVPGSLGLVSTVSGLLTKPGLAVWSTDPGRGLLLGDLAAEARAATRTVEVADGYAGPATVASYTVTYDDGAPSRVVVVGDTPDGRRCVAAAIAPELAARAEVEELIGRRVRVGAGVVELLDA